MNMDFMQNTTLMLLIGASLFFLIQILYYLIIYNRVHRHHNSAKRKQLDNPNTEYPPVSVIIYARGQFTALRRNLKVILEQDYPKYEVIVVNDNKTDECEDILDQLQNEYSHLYHSFLPESSRYISRKKLAITLGVKAAKYDWLVLTEPEACPTSGKWLKMLARNFSTGTDIVLGYSGYDYQKRWLHKRVAFDNLFTTMRYLGMAIAGKPYMGLGRNMAFRKEVFLNNGGYTSQLKLMQGWDDLLVNQTANRRNTRVETDPRAIVRMEPVKYKKDWQEEKINYAASAQYYKGTQRWAMGFETLSRLLLHTSCIVTIVVGIASREWVPAGAALGLWLTRYIVQMLVVNLTAKDLGEKRRFYFSLPLFDILQPLQSLRWKASVWLTHKKDFLWKTPR